MVLPASRRQVFRSPIVSFCRQDAGSTMGARAACPLAGSHVMSGVIFLEIFSNEEFLFVIQAF